MSNIIINGNITGNNAHIGDIYYSYQTYLAQTESLNFTDTEKELVKIIFENTSSEEERKQILDSLKNIKEGNSNEKESSWFVEKMKFLLKKMKSMGQDIATKVIATSYMTDYAKTHDIGDIFK